MDGNRFDALTRRLAAGTTRRRVLGGLAAGLGGLIGAGRAGAQACRAAGSTCTKDANCCSALCDTTNPDPTKRNRCVCPPGTQNCRGACRTAPADYLSDVLNCGACGNRCPVDQCNRATCINGVCGLEPNPARIGKSCDDGNCCTLDDVCQANGVCAGTPVVCDPSRDCEEAGICNPATCQCDYALKQEGTVCRQSGGVCELEARCDGNSPECPANPFRDSSTRCRESIGPCDPAEFCTGSSAACPADARTPNGEPGACTNGNVCFNGTCSCTPRTCEEAGRDCGSIDNGCGGTVSCGTCSTDPIRCGCVLPTDSDGGICANGVQFLTSPNPCFSDADCPDTHFCATTPDFLEPNDTRVCTRITSVCPN